MRITVKGLAQFMTAGPARQRSVVRDFKYPDPEGKARALYYAEAVRAVRRFHRAANDVGVLVDEVARLARESAAATGVTSRRLRDNAAGLRQYATHFAARNYEVLQPVRWALQHGPVVVAVTPDLHVVDEGRERIIKLEFATTRPDRRVVQVITQAMFEAAEMAGAGLQAADVLYVDVRRGEVHGGARIRARLARDIEAACATIADIWNSI